MIEAIANLASVGLGAYDDYQNRKIARENLQYQKDTLQWQKDAQNQTWAREDNSIQRRVADMKSAGLNPILAAGQGASTSAPVKLDTPQRQSEKYTSMTEQAQVALALMQAKENISNTQAQRDLIAQQKINAETENALKIGDYGIRKWDADFWHNRNLPTNAGTIPKNIAGADLLPKLGERIGQGWKDWNKVIDDKILGWMENTINYHINKKSK